MAFELQPNNIRTEEVEATARVRTPRRTERLAASLAQLCALGNPDACTMDAGEVLSEAR